MKTFKDLIVWQKAHLLTIEVYKAVKTFPQDEKFGLVSDMRRAARSVPTNIVEGFYRNGFRDALHFFNISEASLEELKYHLLLSVDLFYLDSVQFRNLENKTKEVGKVLNGWIKSYRPKK